VPASDHDFGDGGLTSEQRVCYRVIAFNRHGESAPSTTGCATPPAAVSDLVARWVDDGLLLTWTDNSAVEESYQVVISTVCTEQTEYWSASTPPNGTSVLLTDITPGNWCGAYPALYGVAPYTDRGYGDVVYVGHPDRSP
jgi:hypothetical protein